MGVIISPYLVGTDFNLAFISTYMRLLVESCLLTTPINAHCSLISHAGNDSQANASNGDSAEDKISLPQLIYHLTPRKDIRLILLGGTESGHV